MVQVQHEDADSLGFESFQPFEESSAVGEAGERVGFREPQCPAFGIAPAFAHGVGEPADGQSHHEHDEELLGGGIGDREPANEQVDYRVHGDGDVLEAFVAPGVAKEGLQVDRPDGRYGIIQGDVNRGCAGDFEKGNERLDPGKRLAPNAVLTSKS